MLAGCGETEGGCEEGVFEAGDTTPPPSPAVTGGRGLSETGGGEWVPVKRQGLLGKGIPVVRPQGH